LDMADVISKRLSGKSFVISDFQEGG
jgi:hypothetical protein